MIWARDGSLLWTTRVSIQILSYPTPNAEGLEPSLAKELTRQANDTLAATISKYPDRLLGFATLPMLDPAAAVRELERTVRDLRFVGALINSHINGRYFDDKFFWPVFECAEALGVPIYLHPQIPPKPVVDAYYSGFAPEISAFLSFCGSRLAHRHWGTLPPLSPRRGVRPVSCAADHRGPQFRDIEFVGMADGLLLSIRQERRTETDHQGIPSGELLRWNPRR